MSDSSTNLSPLREYLNSQEHRLLEGHKFFCWVYNITNICVIVEDEKGETITENSFYNRFRDSDDVAYCIPFINALIDYYYEKTNAEVRKGLRELIDK